MNRRLTHDMFPGGTDERVLKRGDICDRRIIQDILGTLEGIDETEEILQNENAYSAHYLGETRLYQTFSRSTEKEPYRYAGLCARGESGNMHPTASKKVFIISQYHDEDPVKMNLNMRFAAAIARMVVCEFGDIPIAPHIYFPQFMVDAGKERDFGIEAGHLMMRLCDEAILATIEGRISEEMQTDLDYATVDLGLKPIHRNFREAEAVQFIEEMENDIHEEWSRAKHR